MWESRLQDRTQGVGWRAQQEGGVAPHEVLRGHDDGANAHATDIGQVFEVQHHRQVVIAGCAADRLRELRRVTAGQAVAHAYPQDAVLPFDACFPFRALADGRGIIVPAEETATVARAACRIERRASGEAP